MCFFFLWSLVALLSFWLKFLPKLMVFLIINELNINMIIVGIIVYKNNLTIFQVGDKLKLVEYLPQLIELGFVELDKSIVLFEYPF